MGVFIQQPNTAIFLELNLKMNLSQEALDRYLIGIRSCPTWDLMDAYIESLGPAIWKAIYRTISPSPILTMLDIQEIRMWYHRTKCPMLIRPKLMANTKEDTAWRFRIGGIWQTETFGGTFEDVVKYFEYGAFMKYSVDFRWSPEEKFSLYGNWLEGSNLKNVVFFNMTNLLYTYYHDDNAISTYLKAIPDRNLFGRDGTRKSANFAATVCTIYHEDRSKSPNMIYGRMTLVMIEIFRRGLDFQPFGFSGNPVWHIRHARGIKYLEQAALGFEAFFKSSPFHKTFMKKWINDPDNERYMPYPTYNRTDYKSCAPYVQKILLLVGCIGNRMHLHKDLRQMLFEMVVVGLYESVELESDKIRVLEKYYRTRPSGWVKTACLDRRLAVRGFHHNCRMICSMLALSILGHMPIDNKENYIQMVSKRMHSWISAGMKDSKAWQQRQLAEMCYDNGIAISLVMKCKIPLDHNFRILDLEDAKEQTRHFLHAEWARAQNLGIQRSIPSNAKRQRI